MRDPRLPKPFPGCWMDVAWRKNYNRIDMAIRREVWPKCANKREAESPEVRAHRRKMRAERHAIRQRNRRAEQKARRSKNSCYACNKKATTKVVRSHPVSGSAVKVPYCGEC